MPVPKLVTTAILIAAQVALTAMNTTEGPRLTDTKASVAEYGTPCNSVMGTRVVPAHCIFAKDIIEKKKKRKGKGGKQVTYTGYGTFAVQLADHAIASVDRIWLDNHLVYDNTGAGEKIFELADDYELESSLRFYLGGETQQPDPDMLAFIEARDGPGTCPAYRHCSHIYLERIPLENFGNRYPDVKVQISTDAGGEGASELISVDTPMDTAKPYYFFAQSSNRAYGAAYSDRKIAGFAIDDRDFTLTETATDAYFLLAHPAIGNDGTIYYTNDDTQPDRATFKRADMGAGPEVQIGADADLPPSNHLVGLAENADSSSQALVYRFGGATSSAEYRVRSLTGGLGGITVKSAAAQYGAAMSDVWGLTCDRWGDCWTALIERDKVYGEVETTETTLELWRIADGGERGDLPDTITLTGLPEQSSYGPFGGTGSIAHMDGYFLVEWVPGLLVLCDETSGAAVGSIDLRTATGKDFDNYLKPRPKLEHSVNIDQTAVWRRSSDDILYEVSLPGLTITRSVSALLGGTPDVYQGDGYWPYSMDYMAAVDGFAITGLTAEETTPSLEFLFVGGAERTLGALLTQVALRAGLDADEFDFSAATQLIDGYNWTQGTGRQICEHLCDIHDTDLRPHDFLLEAKLRGDEPIGAIPYGDFVADSERPVDKVIPKADEELPRRLFLTFADLNSGQEPNSAMPVGGPAKGATGSAGELSIDMSTLALAPADAQQLVERKQRRMRFGRTTADFAVSRRTAATLEPGDVYTPDLDGEPMTMRLTKLTWQADGPVATEWDRDDPRIAQLPASQGAEAQGYREETVIASVGSVGEVLDLPLLIDAHDQTAPFAYLAAGPGEPGKWLGAQFAASDTGDPDSYLEGWDAIPSGDGAVIGITADALADSVTWLPDRGSELIVDLNAGILTSASLEALLAEPGLNLAAIEAGDSWELVQFMGAELTGDHTYRLTGFLRGLRGTERAMADHAAGDRFVLLDDAIARHIMGADEIGDTDWYIVSSITQAPDEATAETLTYAAESHRPIAPVYGTAEQVGSDWSIDAVRRTRVGGSVLDGQDVSLGQASELWLLEVLDGTGEPVRTIEASALPILYAEADQVADFGAPVAPGALSTRLRMVDPTLNLRGHPLAIDG